MQCRPCTKKLMPTYREMYSNSACHVLPFVLFSVVLKWKLNSFCLSLCLIALLLFDRRLLLHMRVWSVYITWTRLFLSRSAWFPPHLGSRGCAKKLSRSMASPSLKEPWLGSLCPCFTGTHAFGVPLSFSDLRGNCTLHVGFILYINDVKRKCLYVLKSWITAGENNLSLIRFS